MYIKFKKSLPINEHLDLYSSYSLLDEYLTKKEVKSCLAIEKDLNLSDGKIDGDANSSKEGGVVNSSIRKTSIAWIPFNQEVKDQFTKLYDLILPIAIKINQLKFSFNITGMQLLQYGVYTKDSHYDYHNDLSFYEGDGKVVMRKLSIVFSLNTIAEDYEGGEFLLMPHGREPQTFKFKSGDVLAFPSYTPHKVNPVLSGTRKTIVCWLVGPKFI